MNTTLSIAIAFFSILWCVTHVPLFCIQLHNETRLEENVGRLPFILHRFGLIQSFGCLGWAFLLWEQSVVARVFYGLLVGYANQVEICSVSLFAYSLVEADNLIQGNPSRNKTLERALYLNLSIMMVVTSFCTFMSEPFNSSCYYAIIWCYEGLICILNFVVILRTYLRLDLSQSPQLRESKNSKAAFDARRRKLKHTVVVVLGVLIFACGYLLYISFDNCYGKARTPHHLDLYSAASLALTCVCSSVLLLAGWIPLETRKDQSKNSTDYRRKPTDGLDTSSRSPGTISSSVNSSSPTICPSLIASSKLHFVEPSTLSLTPKSQTELLEPVHAQSSLEMSSVQQEVIV